MTNEMNELKSYIGKVFSNHENGLITEEDVFSQIAELVHLSWQLFSESEQDLSDESDG